MRKSVSVAFFSLMSTLLIFGTVIMGGSELVLFSNYFAQERYDVLDEVVNVAQRTASHLVQEAALPEGEELEALNTKLELIGESAEVYLFFTDCDGNVVLASDPDDLAGDVVEASVLEKSAKAKENYHIFGTLDGVLTEKSYISRVYRLPFPLLVGRPAGGVPQGVLLELLPLGLSDAAGGQRPHQGDDA